MKNLLRLILAGALTVTGASAQATTTVMLSSGSTAAKRDLVIIGEGFTAADQATFNSYVQNAVMDQMFREDVFRDAMNAFNIWRVNVNSVDSGVTQINANGVVTLARNTALDYRYSGDHARCYMEPGPNTTTRLANLLAATVPGAEYRFIVLNQAGRGGCRGGDTLAVTRTMSGDVCAHEMGHMVGNLGDEYFSGTATYRGGEPLAPNLTTQTNRALIKWRDYIPPLRPIPTLLTIGMDIDSDVGLFEGASLGVTPWRFGLYRPTFNSRMNNEVNQFCPVGYAAVRDALTGFETRSFLDSVFGDFNGDGRDDTVIHNANSLQLFLSDGSRMIPTWGQTGGPAGVNSQFLVGDFDGDGRDDLFHIWPGYRPTLIPSFGTSFGTLVDPLWSGDWTYRSGDRFHTADFNGDGRTDLIVMNTTSWATPRLGLFQSIGNGMTLVRRYDNSLPGWGWMARGDRAQVGDFDGDGRDDLLLFNGDDWAVPYLGQYRLTGSGLADGQTYEEFLPGWTMSSGDQQFVGDFNGDGRDDIYVRNNINWSGTWNSTNLAMMASTGAGLTRLAIYSDSVPGYSMARGDRCHVADCNGDGRDDLVIFNATDWGTEYLAILRSTGSGVAATFQGDSIGNWNLGAVDKIAIANFNGGFADDVVICNRDWLGLLRSNSTSFSNVRIYPKYIRNVPYHRLGWW